MPHAILAFLVVTSSATPALAADGPPLKPWQEFLSYIVEPFLLEGALLALQISALAMIGGITLGLGLALMRLSNNAVIRGSAWFYIWFVRGTPQLLQLVPVQGLIEQGIDHRDVDPDVLVTRARIQ